MVYTKRHLEIMFCLGLLNQQDLIVDKLHQQIQIAQDKIDQIIKDIDEGKFDAKQQ